MDTIEYIISQEELKETEIALEEQLNNLDLVISLMLDTESETIPESIQEITGFEVSTEAKDDVTTFKEKLNQVYKDINSYIFRTFKRFTPLTSKSKEYKQQLIEKAIRDIEDGTLVPKETLEQSKLTSLNNKLAPFYATGYSLSSGANDLSNYISNIVDLTNRSGRFIKGLMDFNEKLKTSGDVPRLNGILNIKKNIHGVKSTVVRKRTITDFRMSIMNKWFSSTVTIVMLYGRREGGVKLSTEKYVLTNIPKIGTANNSQTIKLLQTALSVGKQLDKVNADLNRTIKLITRDSTMALLDENIDKKRRFLLARFNEAVTVSLINLYKDVYTIDDIVLMYVNKLYERKK